MTDELNSSVLALWQEQKAFLTQAPIFAEQFETDIKAQLSALNAQAEEEGNQTAMWAIAAVWERVQEFKALFDNQQTTANSAGIIITSLKIQRDELATQLQGLLQQLGYQEGQENPMKAFIERLYEDWLETVDTNEAESDAQDELLGVIKNDIEWVWQLEEGMGHIILNALRGNVELTQEQTAALHAFVHAFDD